MSQVERTLIIRSGRSPHEVWLLGACVLAGLAGIASGEQSRAVAASFPVWGRALWYGGLLIWGLVGLAGLAWGRRVEGLLVERAGLVGLTGFCLAFAVGALVYAGLQGIVSGALTVAFAVANIARIWQITRDLTRTRR